MCLTSKALHGKKHEFDSRHGIRQRVRQGALQNKPHGDLTLQKNRPGPSRRVAVGLLPRFPCWWQWWGGVSCPFLTIPLPLSALWASTFGSSVLGMGNLLHGCWWMDALKVGVEVEPDAEVQTWAYCAVDKNSFLAWGDTHNAQLYVSHSNLTLHWHTV